MNKKPQNSFTQRVNVISRHLVSALKSIREVTVSLTVTLVVVALIVIVVRQLLQKSIVVQPIAVPQTMADKGFTSEVTAQWILDQIIVMQNKAVTLKDSQILAQQWQQFDMEVPGSGLSVQTIGQVLRQSLGIEQRKISGEIAETPSGYSMRFRISGNSPASVSLETKHLEFSRLYDDAAQQVMQMVDPYIYAAYLYRSNQHKNLQAALDLIIKFKDLDNQKWAYNLIGSIAHEKHKKENYEAALKAYKKALDVDSSFALVYNNRANTYFKLKKFKQALTDYRKSIKLKDSLRDDKFESKLLERVAFTKKDVSQNKEKIELLKLSIERNSKYWIAHYRLAMAHFDSERGGGYREAAEIFSKLALKDSKEEGKVFEELARYRLEEDVFYYDWGNVLQKLNKCKLAKQKHNKAYGISGEWYFEIEQIIDCPTNP